LLYLERHSVDHCYGLRRVAVPLLAGNDSPVQEPFSVEVIQGGEGAVFAGMSAPSEELVAWVAQHVEE